MVRPRLLPSVGLRDFSSGLPGPPERDSAYLVTSRGQWPRASCAGPLPALPSPPPPVAPSHYAEGSPRKEGCPGSLGLVCYWQMGASSYYIKARWSSQWSSSVRGLRAGCHLLLHGRNQRVQLKCAATVCRGRRIGGSPAEAWSKQHVSFIAAYIVMYEYDSSFLPTPSSMLVPK